MGAKLKVSQAQMAEALNRNLSDVSVTVAGVTFPVRAMTLRQEQEFIKTIRQLVPADVKELSVPQIVAAVTDADPAVLGKAVSLIAASGGVELPAEQVVDGARLTEIIEAIEAQMDRNGYLDFFSSMAARVLNLAAKNST